MATPGAAVLVRRAAYLIAQLAEEPASIVAVTFTNKAANQMRQRLEHMLGSATASQIAIGTFHSICARILRAEIALYTSAEGLCWQPNFVIYDESDSLSIVKSVIKTLNLDERLFAPREMRQAISSLKNDGLSAARYSEAARSYREQRLADIYSAYQGELSRNNGLDFDDLLLVTLSLARHCSHVRKRLSDRFRHILIDEFQDTNPVQYELVRLIAPQPVESWHKRSLFVVGDIDQSIYSWRKADFRIILGFQSDFKHADLVRLEDNYRSTGIILKIANSIIENNQERIAKVLRCNREEGSPVPVYEADDEIDEAHHIASELKRLKARGRSLKDCAVLYRTNAQSRAIEEALVHHHIPYTMVGAIRFYERQEIKDILAYLKLVYNLQDGQSFQRIVNTPRRSLGKTTLEKLMRFASARRMSLAEAAASADKIEGLSIRARAALLNLAAALSRWQAQAACLPVSELIEIILVESGYMRMLEEAASLKDELSYGRIENLQEFQAVAREFALLSDRPDVESFLTRIALVSDLDSVNLSEAAVKLMTLHSAKGLEFDAVFLAGLEEGLFPHQRSLDLPSALEEERRLMYVGVTRAENLLYLSYARRRMRFSQGSYGGSMYATASRFLEEIPAALIAGFHPALPAPSSRQPVHLPELSESAPGWSEDSPAQTVDQPLESTFPGKAGWPQQRSANQQSREKLDGDSEVGLQAERFAVGDRVVHSRFGTGTVVDILGKEGRKLYNIDFLNQGKRLLDPRTARLVKLS